MNLEDGARLLEAMGYKKLMRIKEQGTTYSKSGLELEVKNIENGDKLIEIETVANNLEMNTIEKLIQKVNSLNLPIENDNYFVKKAEIELEKIINEYK